MISLLVILYIASVMVVPGDAGWITCATIAAENLPQSLSKKFDNFQQPTLSPVIPDQESRTMEPTVI